MRSEFEFIRNIKEKYGLKRVGDDCAVLPLDAKNDMVVTTDLLVEDIDFRLEWTRPELLGHKALAVSLSDIAAMGATPKWAVLSVGVPEAVWLSSFLDKLYEGWFSLAKVHGVELTGGDISRTPDKVVIDSFVIGKVSKGRAVLRSGARAGDSIFVTGSFGGAAAGLSILESGTTYSSTRGRKRNLVERNLCPTPRVEIGQFLQRRNLATSMIDVSDGLAADLHHLCEESNVGARIDLDSIPVDPSIHDIAPDQIRELVIAGGEDFELLFTSQRKKLSGAKSAPITRIGEVTSRPGIIELIDGNSTTRLPRAGYRHF